jgi:hypothetical protein
VVASDSNFFGQNAYYKQVLLIQISLVKCWLATGAKFSNFLGRQAGYSATTAM